MNTMARIPYALLVLFFLQVGNAQIPRTISYQGALTDTAGNPLPDGSYIFTFRLYTDSTDGSPLWIGARTVQVKRGLFSTQLGGTSDFPDLFTAKRWLSVQIETDPEISHRIPLLAGAYAFRSMKADTATVALSAPTPQVVDSARIAGTVPNGAITNAKLAPDAVTTEKILNGTIQRADVAPNFKSPLADSADYVRNLPPIDSARIAGTVPNGAITNAKLAPDAVTTEKILNGTIQRADVAPNFKSPLADSADYVRNLPPIDSARIAGTVPNGAITNAKLAPDAVTTEKILNGTILFQDLGQNGAVPGQVMKWTGTAWAARNDSVDGVGITSLSAGTPGLVSGTSGLTLSPNPITSTGSIAIANSGITNAMIASGAVDSGKIALGAIKTVHVANGAINNAQLAPNAVASANIQDGSILFQDIAQNGAVAGQVMKWTGTAWAPRNDSLGTGGVGGSGAAGHVAIWNTATSLLGTNNFFWDITNARLGLGTTTPYTQLTLTNTLGFTNGTTPLTYIYQSGTVNARRTLLAHSPGFSQWGLAYNDLADQMLFQQDSLNPVLSVGIGSKSVGINTASPDAVLDVRGGTQGVYIQNSPNANTDDIVIKRPGLISPGNIRFSLSQRNTNSDLWLYGYDGTTFKNFLGFDYANNEVALPANGATLFVDLDSARVGMRTRVPTEALDVNGNIRVRNMPVFQPSGDRYDVHAFPDGTFYTILTIPEPSSAIDPRRLSHPERVLQLTPYEFTWERTRKADVGFLPDDVEKVATELIAERSEQYPEGIKYDKLTLYLLEIVKEQQKQIAALESAVRELEQRASVERPK